MTKKKLSAAQEKAAKQFRNIWDEKHEALGLTQKKAAILCEWSHQSAFSEFLNGNVPLNIKAVLKVASVLEVLPEDIYPELVAEIRDLFGKTTPFTGDQPPDNNGLEIHMPVYRWEDLEVWPELPRPAIRTVTAESHIAQPETCFVVTIEGDDMPLDFSPGDELIVDRDFDLKDGFVYLVKLPGFRHVAIRKYSDGQFVNSTSPRPSITPADVEIMALVVEQRVNWTS